MERLLRKDIFVDKTRKSDIAVDSHTKLSSQHAVNFKLLLKMHITHN